MDLPTGNNKISDTFATIPDQSIDAIANRIEPRQISTGMGRGVQYLGSDKIYSDAGARQIVVEDDAVPRVLDGKHATLGEGFYVSKPNINVKTNTDPAQFIFNSNQNIFKIVSSGTFTIPAYAAGVNDTIWSSQVVPHGLTYIPILEAYALVNQYYNASFPSFDLEVSRSYVALPFNAFTGTLTETSIRRYEITIGVDANNIYLSYYYATTTGGSYNFPEVPIKYYLRQETAT